MKKCFIWVLIIGFVVLLPNLLIVFGDYLTYGVRIEENISDEPKTHSVLGKTYEVIREDLFLQKKIHDSHYYLDCYVTKVIKRDGLGKETEQIANIYEVIKNVEKGFRFTVTKVTVRKTVFGEYSNRFHVYANLKDDERLIKNVDVSLLFCQSSYSSNDDWIFIPEKRFLQEVTSQ